MVTSSFPGSPPSFPFPRLWRWMRMRCRGGGAGFVAPANSRGGGLAGCGRPRKGADRGVEAVVNGDERGGRVVTSTSIGVYYYKLINANLRRRSNWWNRDPRTAGVAGLNVFDGHAEDDRRRREEAGSRAATVTSPAEAHRHILTHPRNTLKIKFIFFGTKKLPH